MTSLVSLTIKNYQNDYLKIPDNMQIFLCVDTNQKKLIVEGMYLRKLTVNSRKLISFDATPSTFVEDIELNCPKLKQANITGLTNLKSFKAKNAKLTGMDFNSNSICTIDLSGAKELFDVRLSFNPLGTIDLSNQQKLVWLALENCKLKQLDVSKCTKLGSLGVQKNQLSVIKCSKNKELFNTTIYDNKGLKKVYIKDKKNVVKKVLTKTKVTGIKRVSVGTITFYYKKNPYASGYLATLTDNGDGISGPVGKNARSASITYLKKGMTYKPEFKTQIKVNGVYVYGTHYIPSKRY